MYKPIKISSVFILVLIFGFQSCDKIENPVIPTLDIDTSVYPGNFSDYEFPTFGINTNTDRNALIEDYTGHQCPFCPPAAATAEEIVHNKAENRVFVASIHASATVTGNGPFQKTDDFFVRDFTNPQGLEMGSTFGGLSVGFGGNPRGNISRTQDDAGQFFFLDGQWEAYVDEVLSSPLNINIQAKSNYFEETRGFYLHTESKFENDLVGNYNIIVYAIENEFIGPQKMPDASKDTFYVHRDIHLGNLFGETWGRSLATGSIVAGTVYNNVFSYYLPEGLNKEDMHFLVIVINRETYEVIQVIKHEL